MIMSNSVSTETASIETSVPTDLTVTSHGQSEASSVTIEGREKFKHHFLIEKLRLEVKERDAKIKALVAQNEETISRVELKKNSECSEKQAKIHLIEAELHSTQEQLRLIKERTAKELANLMQKCTHFQQAQQHINITQDEVKSSLENLHLSEEGYSDLKKLPVAQLNLREFASLRLHEIIVPLKVKLRELTSTKASLSSALTAREQQINDERDNSGRNEKKLSQLTERVHTYEQTCKEYRDNAKTDDFRVVNFDRVRQERDKLEEENYQLRKDNGLSQSTTGALRQEKEAFETKLVDSHQKCLRLEQEYLRYKNDAADDSKQLARAKEELRGALSSLALERDKMNDLHKKYLQSRSENISLSDSVRQLENKMKIVTEKYEHASKGEANVEEKYFKIVRAHEDTSHELEILKQKYSKEKDMLTFQLDEARQSLEIVSRGNEASKMELGMLKEQCDKAELSLNYERRKYDSELSLLTKELSQYRALEGEYKATITAIASHPDGPRPSTIVAGKLSDEAIDLTRRVLQLERHNMQACDTIRKLTTALDQLKRQIKSYKRAVSLAGKPSSDLLETIASQEDQILCLEEALGAVRDVKRRSESDLVELNGKYSQLIAQFRNALEERDDLNGLKEEVVRISKAFTQQQCLPSAITVSKDPR